MVNYTSALLDDLYHDLQEISDYDNELQCFERSYYAVESKMKQLKEFSFAPVKGSTCRKELFG